jgi:meso-butanediol dehydrogenase/(S,S)-butanediol dehydrogenase/diacetyl reductase
MRLEGKVALITGGGQGIGAAIAERFVADGAKICITGRTREKLDRVAGSLPAGSVTTCVGDVTSYEDAERMVETTLAFAGKVDVLVNNAAIDPGGSVTQLDPALWRKVIETNLTGPFLLMKATLPHMMKLGGGSIINIASLRSWGSRSSPTSLPSCLSVKGR